MNAIFSEIIFKTITHTERCVLILKILNNCCHILFLKERYSDLKKIIFNVEIMEI